MLGDLAVLGYGIRVLLGAVQRGRSKDRIRAAALARPPDGPVSLPRPGPAARWQASQCGWLRPAPRYVVVS